MGVPVKDTIKVVGPEGRFDKPRSGEPYGRPRRPRSFPGRSCKKAYAKARLAEDKMTDDAALVERTGHPVRIVPGSYRNLKITTPDDLPAATALLQAGRNGVRRPRR